MKQFGIYGVEQVDVIRSTMRDHLLTSEVHGEGATYDLYRLVRKGVTPNMAEEMVNEHYEKPVKYNVACDIRDRLLWALNYADSIQDVTPDNASLIRYMAHEAAHKEMKRAGISSLPRYEIDSEEVKAWTSATISATLAMPK